MPFTGQQLNTYGPRPQRIFPIDAIKSGLPVTVLHVFLDTTATMRVKLPSLFSLVDPSGPEMDRGETVTVFNPKEVTVRATSADGTTQELTTTVRIDTPAEAGYYHHGGILQYVLRQLLER